MAPGVRMNRKSSSVGTTTRSSTLPVEAEAAAPSAHQIVASSPPLSPSSETGAPLPKRRGPTIGKGVEKMIARNSGRRIHVYVDPQMRAFCGLNAARVANELGTVMRRTCPLVGFSHTWKRVDSMLKEVIAQAVRDKFRITENGQEDTVLVKEVVDEKLYKLYKDWKQRMDEYYKAMKKEEEEEGVEPYQHPYPGADIEGWKYMIDHIFNDPKFEKRKKACKLNRKDLPHNHTMGSQSFPAAMSIEAEADENHELPEFCGFFKKSHTKKGTGPWISPNCEQLYDKMVAIRDEAIESGTPMTQEEISRAGLGEKKSYLRGFGVGPKPSSLSSKSSIDLEQVNEIKQLKSNMNQLQEERQREREERQREREEAQNRLDAQQKQIDELKSIVARVVSGPGTY